MNINKDSFFRALSESVITHHYVVVRSTSAYCYVFGFQFAYEAEPIVVYINKDVRSNNKLFRCLRERMK